MAEPKAAADDKQKRNVIAISLDDDTYEKIKRLAEADERSVNQFLARFVRRHFDTSSKPPVGGVIGG